MKIQIVDDDGTVLDSLDICPAYWTDLCTKMRATIPEQCGPDGPDDAMIAYVLLNQIENAQLI